MARPSFFLVCSVRLPEKRMRWFFPIPLFVLDDLLETVLSVWNLVSRFKPELHDVLNRHLPEIRAALHEVPQLISVLRTAGPFTMVEVAIPDEGVEVTVKLI